MFRSDARAPRTDDVKLVGARVANTRRRLGRGIAELPAVPALVIPPSGVGLKRLPTVQTEVTANPLRHRVITFAYVGATIHSPGGLRSIGPAFGRAIALWISGENPPTLWSVGGDVKQWRINWPLLLALLIILVIFVVIVVLTAHNGSNTIPPLG